jgi:hypothetical protein
MWFVVVDWRGFFTPLGRPPTAREIAAARPPYESTSGAKRRRARIEVPDDELDDAAAIAYAEQRRQPADLINVAA